MKVSDLFSGVWVGKPLKLRDLYDPKQLDKALSAKPTAQTVTIKNNSTGEIVGKRTIYQK
jgi:hypothetical protein